MAEATVSNAVQGGFDSRTVYQRCVAQLAEARSLNLRQYRFESDRTDHLTEGVRLDEEFAR
jgi:hypothetical protein